MIGDFVRIVAQPSFNYYEYKPLEIVRVNEILDNGINPDWCGAEVNGIIPFEDIEPIVLTQEILEKNGWRYNKVDDVFYPKMLKGELPWIVGKEGLFRVKDFCTISYVHQLQHALRLCGIDKDVEVQFFE